MSWKWVEGSKYEFGQDYSHLEDENGETLIEYACCGTHEFSIKNDEVKCLIEQAPNLLSALKAVIGYLGVEDAEQLKELIDKAEGRG